MNTTTWRGQVRRTLAVLTTTALAGGAVVVGTGTTAAADEPVATVTSGSAQWGVKASFRNYVTGFGGGTVAVASPATETSDGFEFVATGGTVDGTTAEIDFAGGVAFTAHDGALDIAFSELRVRIDGGDQGTLIVDATSRESTGPSGEAGELIEFPAVELGAIDLSENPLTVSDGVASVSGAPVILTEAGAPAFGGFYQAGAELDPLSFEVDLAPATVAPEIAVQPQDVTVDEGEDAVFSAAATGTPEPAVRWQTRSGADAEWQEVAEATATELTLADATVEQDGTEVRAVFSNGTAPDVVTESATLTVTAAEEPGELDPGETDDPDAPLWEPAIEVFAADGTTPIGDTAVTYGDTVVVKGTGFAPEGNVGSTRPPIMGDLPQGTYVVFGKFANEWRPSQGAPSSARKVGSQQWVLAADVLEQVAARFQDAIRAQWVDIAADGSFTAELEVKRPVRDGVEEEWPVAGNFGVYTYAAGGATNADQELTVPLTVVEEPTEPEEPAEWEPAIEVFAADGETPLGDTEVTHGDTVVVRGTGFDPAANVGGHGVPIPSTLPQGTYVVFGSFADQWRPSEGAASSTRVIGAQKWALAEGVLNEVPAQFQGAVRKDWVPIAPDGSFTAELTLGGIDKDWPEDGTFGVYTYAAGGMQNADQELAVPVNFVAQPRIEVFRADGVTPVADVELVEGDTVVVKGTGFDPAANVGGRGAPIPADQPQGTYVVFGKFPEQWRPSQGVENTERIIGDQRWALAEDVLNKVPDQFQGAIRDQWVDIAPDGSFTAELEIASPTDRAGNPVAWPEDGIFGVYTYGAGGVTNADQELRVPLTVVDARQPQLTVTPTENLAVDTVVTVEGTGYAPHRAISVAFTADLVKHEDYGWPVGWLNHEVVTTDALGNFSREITVSGWVTGTGDDCSEATCYLATFNSAQSSDAVDVDRRAERDQDAFVPVSFVAGYPLPDPAGTAVSATPDPVRQGEQLTVVGSNLPVGADVTATLERSTVSATGFLDWGVKESFRSYITGPIAHGEITTSEDVAANPDGTYRFLTARASVDEATETATLDFSGSIAFRGHDVEGTPALDVRLADLRVQLTADSAVLLADATSRSFEDFSSAGELTEYPDVVLATLDRESFAVDGGTVVASGAAATLTAAGVPAFAGFYDANDALDPVSVDVTVGGIVPATLALDTVAEAGIVLGSEVIGENGRFESAWDVGADVPAGGYDVVLRDSQGAVLASDGLTVLAAVPATPEEPSEPEQPGEPEETNPGTVVVDPDPVERGATATIIGSDLEPGTRVGAVIDAAGVPGTLEWGVKESFRSYITGPIADGDISVASPAARSGEGFTFGSGSGRGDTRDATAGFAGAVSFTGHEIKGTAALQVTIAEPSVVIEDGAGHLVANVRSRSLDGEEVVDYPRVRLAELDLAGVEVVDGRLVGTDVPAHLTADGVPAFADFYDAGDPLDPVTFSVPVGEGTELDLGTLDVAEATVAEDGTVELTWSVPADIALGEHRVDLVIEGASVADTTVTVVAADSAPSGDGTAGGTSAAGGRLATTGGEAAALVALSVVMLLGGAVLARRRQLA